MLSCISVNTVERLINLDFKGRCHVKIMIQVVCKFVSPSQQSSSSWTDLVSNVLHLDLAEGLGAGVDVGAGGGGGSTLWGEGDEGRRSYMTSLRRKLRGRGR